MSTFRDFRVFISYNRNDEKLVRKLERALKDNGLTPMRDKNFAYGIGFHDQIKRFIEYAHVFMPVLTGPPKKRKGQCRDSQRAWVNQEIGFALSQNIPVLPVAIDWEPGEWLQMLHSVLLSREDVMKRPRKLRRILTPQLFRDLLNKFRDERHALYTCGFLQEDRTAMIVQYANEVAELQTLLPDLDEGPSTSLSSMVRQKGALSSFHIPDEPVSADVWRDRYGMRLKPEHHCRLQREERLALTRHAKRWGCRLIIDPTKPYTDLGRAVKLVRLQCLLKFMESHDVEHIEVAFDSTMPRAENITILGNWFLAQAVAAGTERGYYQTILTRHAPSMRAKIEEFDDEFRQLLEKDKCTPESSRVRAIERIRDLIDALSCGSESDLLDVPGGNLATPESSEIEPLARHMHAAWKKQLEDQGWHQDADLDRRNKTHPELVNYDALPADAKAENIFRAEQVLRGLLSLGYRIEKSNT